MTILNFKGYHVENMDYQRNDNFQHSNKRITLNPTLNVNTEINEKNISVTLGVSIGSLDNNELPFKVSCTVKGKFEYNPEEDTTNIGLDTFIRNNCTAILYPYVRALVSTLTNSSNEFNGYNMPTINVSNYLEKQDKMKD